MTDTKYLNVFQKGFNYSQDGEGNRLIIHLQGCNMKCPWCSNPEGMSLTGVLMTEKEWLKESCCPKGAVREGMLDRALCVVCDEKACLKKRQKGIRLSYKRYSVEELTAECIASSPMFFDGGGVTLTGGEISMQFEGVKALLEQLGEAGIHRAIESNGSHPRMEELIPLTEQWIMDVKHYDDAVHHRVIGVSNANTLHTMKKVAAEHPNVLIRIPLIPGFNDAPEDAKRFAKLFQEALQGSSAKVELLTYHEFGKGKWEQCGMEYRMPAVRIAPGTVELFEQEFGAVGITCART